MNPDTRETWYLIKWGVLLFVGLVVLTAFSVQDIFGAMAQALAALLGGGQ